MAIQTSFCRVDEGINLEYVLIPGPTDETLVIIHGLGPDLQQFEPQADYFKDYFQVLLISLRGHGNSGSPLSPDDASYAIRTLSRDILRVSDHLGIDTFHFIGNSLGGVIGSDLLEFARERILSLVMFGTTPRLVLSRYLIFMQKWMLKLLGRKITAWMVSWSASKDKVVGKKFSEMVKRADHEAVVQITDQIGRYDYMDTLLHTETPLLIIRGGLDQQINNYLDPCLEALYGRPNLHQVDLPEGGHVMNMELPDAFNQALHGFLKEIK